MLKNRMKKQLAAVSRAVWKVVTTSIGAVAWVAAALIGTWSPPRWLSAGAGAGGRYVRRHRVGVVRTVVVLSGLAVAGWQGWLWWEAHKPVERPLVVERMIEGTLGELGKPQERDAELVPRRLSINFSESAAPIEQLKKKVSAGLEISPAVEGEWTWTSETQLEFVPALDWPAGSKFLVRVLPAALGTAAKLKASEWELVTAVQEASIKRWEFVTSEKDPGVHELVGEIFTTYPTSEEDLRQHLELRILDGAKVFKNPGTEPLFSLTRDEKSLLHWYLRSLPVSIPEKTTFAALDLKKGLAASTGGEAATMESSLQVAIPDKFSGLTIQTPVANITLDAEGEPHQVLFIQANQSLRPEDLAGKVSVWQLSESDWDSLSSEVKVNEAMLKRATAVPLTPKENLAPVSRMYGYEFLQEGKSRMVVRVAPGVTCPAGFEDKLGQISVVAVPGFPRALQVTGNGSVLALQGERKIQIKSRGVDQVKVTLGRVRSSEIQHLVTQNDSGDFALPDFNGNFPEESLVRRKEFILKVNKKNDYQACYTAFDFSEAVVEMDPTDPNPSRGLFFVDIVEFIPEAPKPEDTSVQARVESPDDDDGDSDRDSERGWRQDEDLADRRFILLTDLGLLEKRNADESRDVFVQSLMAGGPRAGVTVQLLARNGEVLATTTTDADGHGFLPAMKEAIHERTPIALTAMEGNDFSYLPLRRRQLQTLDYSRFQTDGFLASRIKAVEAFLFSERGIYRPGDTIHMGSLVRRRDWSAVLDGLPLQMTLSDPSGRKVSEQSFRLTSDGFWIGDFKTDENWKTGVYQASLAVLSADNPPQPLHYLGSHSVRLEEFLPDRMKLAVALDPAPTGGWVKPDALTIKYELRSLFGTAEAGNRVTTQLHLAPRAFSFEGWKGFTFHDRSAEASRSTAGQEEDLGEVKTDDQGNATVELDLSKYEGASFRLGVMSEAFESDGGRSVRGATSLLVSPWDEIIGYKSDGDLDYIGKDSARNVTLVALDSSAKPVAVAGLKLRTIESREISVLTERDDGTFAYQSVERDNPVGEVALELAAEPRVLAVPTAQAGSFRFEVINGADQILCVVPFHVVGKGNNNRSLDRDSELRMRLAKNSVRPGEEIEMEIIAPFGGSGVVTLERDKVLASQWFSLKEGGGIVRMKVPETLEGTVYVNATFVRALDSPEIFMSPLSYAVQPVTVEPVRRELTLKLDTPTKVLPGTELIIGCTSSQKSRVIVYAVDEGIHQITNYKLPSPIGFFFRKQALEVKTLQWFDLLLPEYRFLLNNAAFGGDGDGDALSQFLNPFKRKREEPVVWWSGLIDAGPDRTELRWTVPEYFAGGLNVMAIAVNSEAVGTASTHLIARSPLVLNPNAPTFAAPDDEFIVSLGVTNVFEEAGDAEVTVKAEANGPVILLDGAEQTVVVPNGQEKNLRFRVKGGKELGGAGVKFVATARGMQFKREATFSIRPAGPRITSVQSGYFRLASKEVPTPRVLFEQFREGSGTVSVTPVSAAAGLLQYVAGYPHGCSEQITSRGFAKLAMGPREEFGQSQESVASSTESALGQLYDRQSSKGWFGYWGGAGGEGMDFLTLYVMHFVIEARDKGHPVPDALLGRGKNALKVMAAQPNVKGEEAWLRAYAIYLRTRAGEVTTPDLLSLRDTLEKNDKASWNKEITGMLAACTYKLLKQDDEANKLAKTFLKETGKFAAFSSGSANYWSHSDVKRLLAFALCCKHFPELVKDFGYKDWQSVLGCVWEERFNTLTASYACLGLSEFSAQVAGGSNLKVIEMGRDGKSAPLTTTGSLFQSTKFSAGAKALRFEMADAKGADIGAFYQVTQAGFDTAPPKDQVKDGIEVFRTLTDDKGKPLTKVKVADSVVVTLSVRGLHGKDIPNVAVLDLLPGGFEVEKGELKPGQQGDGVNIDVREDRNVFFTNLRGANAQTFTYRIKPVCAGKFVVPPPFAESMYDRGLNGRGASAQLEVETRE